MSLELNIVTPEKTLVANGELDEVFVPAFKGQLNILPGHAPLVSTLTEGVLEYKLKGEAKNTQVAISWGYVQVTPHSVNILAETAEFPQEIDLDRAKKALIEAEESLNKADATPDDVEKYHRKRRRAEARIAVGRA